MANQEQDKMSNCVIPCNIQNVTASFRHFDLTTGGYIFAMKASNGSDLNEAYLFRE